MRREENMSKWTLPLMCAVAGLLLVAFTPPVYAEDYQYVGHKKCSMCHKGEKKGMQKEKWMERGHYKAFKSLQTDKAKKLATAAGLTVDPAEAPQCLKCHTTGYGLDAARFKTGFVKEDGVTCEACHGAGSGYWKPKTMKDHDAAVAAGLNVITKKNCVTCHKTEGNPTFKEFNFEEAIKAIAHPIPKG